MKQSIHVIRVFVPLKVLVGLILVSLVVAPSFAVEAKNAGAKGLQKRTVLMIPVSALASDNATTTVSVLRDSLASANTIFDLCQSDQKEQPQGEKGEITKQAKGLCQLFEGFVKDLDTPRNEFQASDYLVTVPLKQRQGEVEAVTWTSKNLEGAIAFMDVLQGGRLKGVNVYSSYPSARNEDEPCSACPIKDLIFHAASIKEHKEFLEGRAQ